MGALERSDIRASDGDREKTALQLRHAYSDGCLTSDEFEERMDRALAARTRDDLRRLTRDLPRNTRPRRERIDQIQRKAFREHAWTYGAVNSGLVGIWAATGADAGFWPIWSIVPWGLMLAWHGRTSKALTRRLSR